MAEYNMLTGDNLQLNLPPEPQLSDFLYDNQKETLQQAELAVIGVGLLVAGYLTYTFIKI